MDTPDSLAQSVLINGEAGGSLSFPGLRFSEWFGVPMLFYQGFGDNVSGLMFVHVLLWSGAALLAINIIYKWRGKLKFFDALVPIIFLNPSTIQTVSEQWLHVVIWVLYTLTLVTVSRGYLKPWKMVVAFVVIGIGTFSPGGIAVSIAALFFYGVHWIRTKWYTSAFLSIWILSVISVYAFIVFQEALPGIHSGFLDYPLQNILFNWMEIFYGRWAYALIFHPIVHLLLLILSVIMCYWLVHPWIRPRKRPNRERDLLLLIGSLALILIGGIFLTHWNGSLGGYTALTLFALYWSSQIQRRWPKQTFRWVYGLLVLILLGSWVEYQYFLDPESIYTAMWNLGFSHFRLG
ncbi:MAG: hypothetical protein HWD92_05015 [Flavobacteriia bacterium]|nr:hypothetical protein [Flavobacteriia bacterium]